VAALDVMYKGEPFFHHIRFHPGHPPGVNDVPGLVLTMSPVCTIKPPNRPLQPTRDLPSIR
jgi:hypothetical protein